MVVAEQTTVSTAGIWVIIVVALFFLAIWLVGISVADNIQIRESRRWRQQRDAELALGAAPARGTVEPPPGETGLAAGEAEPDRESTGTAAVPGQRRGPGESAGQQASRPTLPTLDGAGDFRRDSAEAAWRTETST
jgi:hypothetical protein